MYTVASESGDAPRHEEPERDGGVEVPARDVPERGDHDPDREAVGERDRDQSEERDLRPGSARREKVQAEDRPGADERQRERADELGDSATERVVLHARDSN